MNPESRFDIASTRQVQRIANWHELIQNLASATTQNLACTVLFATDRDHGDDMTDFLSSDEYLRLRTMTHKTRSRQFSVTRGRLRQLLSALLDCDPRDVPIHYGRHGKPQLSQDAASDIQFSVSHSGPWAAIAWSCHVHVGVDIELEDQKLKLNILAQQLFESAPLDAWQLLDPSDQRRMILASWVLRESILKSLGVGIKLGGAKFASLDRMMDPEQMVVVPSDMFGASQSNAPSSIVTSSKIDQRQSVDHRLKLYRFQGTVRNGYGSLACLLSSERSPSADTFCMFEINN